MSMDSLVFQEDGRASYLEDPKRHGILYCRHCKAWHFRPRLETGTEFCAFCSTTHHSRACGAGLREKCSTVRDPIHEFLSAECERQRKLDLSFCVECNCYHSKRGWKICLERNRPKSSWSQRRKLFWRIRWNACSGAQDSEFRTERSLFNKTELERILPYEYPLAKSKFEHHRST
ncbi:MAG: hypothetical protein JRN52_12545 [Nitrososphaerota archaeon]|nr:hypothetical protein [Nitrososphaerota archaeon]